MNLTWWWIGGALCLQLVIILMLATVGNPVLFKSKRVLRQEDGALRLTPGFADFAFTVMIFSVSAGLGFGTDGWPRYAIWALYAACLWLTWQAYRHCVILTEDHMTVLAWRRFEVRRQDITSYQVERDASEGDAIMWIDVQAGARKCRLRKGLVGSPEQERAMLDFLAAR